MAVDRPEFNMTVLHAAENGTRRDLLVAMRRRLAEALEDERTQSRDLSPIVMRLREISAEIVDIDTREGTEPSAPSVDEPFDGGAL